MVFQRRSELLLKTTAIHRNVTSQSQIDVSSSSRFAYVAIKIMHETSNKENSQNKRADIDGNSNSSATRR